jgi:hypothetical protein
MFQPKRSARAPRTSHVTPRQGRVEQQLPTAGDSADERQYLYDGSRLADRFPNSSKGDAPRVGRRIRDRSDLIPGPTALAQNADRGSLRISVDDRALDRSIFLHGGAMEAGVCRHGDFGRSPRLCLMQPGFVFGLAT